MATTWKAPTWRMPNDKNQNKFESYSLEFNGSDNRIEIPYTELNGATNCTISFWAKINYAADSEPKYPLTLTSGTDFDIMWVFNATGTALDVYIGTVNFRLDGSFNKDIAEWNHWVLRFDGSQSFGNRTKVYQNGQQLTNQAGWGAATSIPTASHLIIGGRNLGSTAWYYQFPGNISDISIFNYTISETQVSSLYNSGSPINPMTLKPAPITYYPLGGNASTGGDSTNTLSVPNVAVPDASVFDFVESNTQYIDIGTNNSALMPVDEMTISLWVKFSAAAMGNTRGLFSANSASGYDGYVIWKDNSNKIAFLINDGSWKIATRTTAVVQDTWYHVVGTWNGSTARIYVDNVDEANVSVSSINYNASTVNRIGDYANDEMDGNITNVQFWNKGLSAVNVTTLYNNGQPLMTGTQPEEANLKAWYKLDQSANWEADTAGNWQIPDAVSSYPQSFDFNGLRGADGYPKQEIITPNVPQGQNFTFSCWANFNNPTANLYHPLIVVYSGSTSIIQMVKTRSGVTNANQVYFTIRNTSNNQVLVYSNVVPTANEWCHIAGTYDGSNVTIYFNGVAGQSLAQTGDTIASGPIEIGSWYYWNTTYGANFDGQISNVQYFDTALPATGADSIETLYNNGTPLTTAIATDNLKAWYKLNNNDRFQGNWRNIDYGQDLNYTKALSRIGPDNGITSAGSGDRVNCGNDSSLQITGAMSISLWFRVNTISPLHSYNFVMGRSRFGTEAPADACWTLLLKGVSYGNPANFRFRLSDGTTATNYDITETTNGDFFNDRWQNLIITYDGTTNANSIKAYLNGELHQQFTSSQASINNIAARNLTFYDNDVYQYGDPTYTGALSNCAIWNKKLEASDISSIWNNGSPALTMPSESELQGWWKFSDGTYNDGNTSWSFPDSSQNSNTGQTYTFTTSATAFDANSMSDNNVQAGTGISSGMTEQNLVNNNVSALNGESSGMDTSNLVTSTLTRQVPYNSYSLNFDAGNPDYILTSFAPASYTGFSVSAWVYADSLGSFNVVASQYRNGEPANSAWFLETIGSDMAFGVANGSSLAYATKAFSTGGWYHIVGVWNGSTAEVYIDGVASGSPVSISGMNTGTVDMAIGALWNSAGTSIGGGPWDGKISNVSVFNQALTSTEILKLYNSGVPEDLSSFNPSPTAWWSLGSDSYFNGANYICPDLVGSNNGTSSGMDANALIGDAPNSTANGTSTNMAIDANLTGNAPNSSNNSFSVNMDYTDRETSVPG